MDVFCFGKTKEYAFNLISALNKSKEWSSIKKKKRRIIKFNKTSLTVENICIQSFFVWKKKYKDHLHPFKSSHFASTPCTKFKKENYTLKFKHSSILFQKNKIQKLVRLHFLLLIWKFYGEVEKIKLLDHSITDWSN